MMLAADSELAILPEYLKWTLCISCCFDEKNFCRNIVGSTISSVLCTVEYMVIPLFVLLGLCTNGKVYRFMFQGY